MTTDSTLRTRIRGDLINARRQRDSGTVSALRTLLAALENAESVPVGTVQAAGALEQAAVGAGAADVPRRELTQAEESAILRAEIDSLDEAARSYDGIAPERADELRAALAVLVALQDG